MRIGITCFASYGGSGVVATELGKALAGRGHEVHFVCDHVPVRLAAGDRTVHVHAVEVPTYPVLQDAPYQLALSATLADVSERCGLDILHMHYAVPHAAAAVAARAMVDRPVAVVTTLHGSDVTQLGAHPALKRAVRHALLNCDGVTAVSRFLAREARRVLQLDETPQVIYNFVDTDEFRPRRSPAARSRLARPDEALLVHVSNFRPIKQVPLAVAVLARVLRRRPARLVLVGEGPQAGAVCAEADRLGVSDYVEFLGEQSAVADIVAQADVFLLPSTEESFGLGAAEAMACGVPVVASAVGGLPEVVAHGVTGFLHAPDDVDGMAASVLRILADGELAARLGAAGAARVRGLFATADAVSRYERFYQRVLGRRDAARAATS